MRGFAPVMSQVPRPPAATISVGSPCAVECVGQPDERVVRRLRLLHPQRAVGLEHAVALVAEQAAQAQAGLALDVAREPDRLLVRARPRAVKADVVLDEHADPRARGGGRGGELVGVAGALDRDRDRPDARDPGELGRLQRSDGLVGDQDLVEARLDHRARLPQRRRGQPDRPRLELLAAEDRALVDLHVRAQCGRQPVHAARHLGDVALDLRQIEQQGRRRRRVARRADQSLCGLERVHAPHASGS